MLSRKFIWALYGILILTYVQCSLFHHQMYKNPGITKHKFDDTSIILKAITSLKKSLNGIKAEIVANHRDKELYNTWIKGRFG